MCVGEVVLLTDEIIEADKFAHKFCRMISLELPVCVIKIWEHIPLPLVKMTQMLEPTHLSRSSAAGVSPSPPGYKRKNYMT